MPRPKKAVVEQPKTTRSKSLKTLKGFRDVLPGEQRYFEFIYEKFTTLAKQYGYARIETPTLEETALYVRSVGKQTDIVSKEMFSFVDAGGNNVSLRPEGTAGVARAYIEHGMLNKPQPVKLFYWSSMFRREKPQAGRYRQHWQYGMEVIGSVSSVVDAQLISFLSSLYEACGLKNVVINVNSNGCMTCRTEYVNELLAFYRSKRKHLCEDCKKRLTKNPLRLLDCKQPTCKEVSQEAPQILDWLDDECKNHFMSVLEYLDGMEISYILNPLLVRGLDYYTKTVFEIFPEAKENQSQSALSGGGRYDGLVEMLGGQETPACGFGAGVERLAHELRYREIDVANKQTYDIFVAQIGEQAKIRALKLFERLRKAGISVAENFSKDGLKPQLESANKHKVRYALIIGQKEVLDGTTMVRDMESGVQEVIDYEKVESDLKKKLEKN